MKCLYLLFAGILAYFIAFPCNSMAQTLTANGPTTFCQGDSVTLLVPLDTSVSYTWLRDTAVLAGQQGHQLVVTSSGNYRVVRSSINNCCDTSNSITIHVNPLPTATISHSGTLTVYCIFQIPTLTTTHIPGATYQWFRNNVAVAGATSTSFFPGSIGVYHVVVTDSNTCKQQSLTLTIVGGTPPASPVLSVTSVPCSGRAQLQCTAVSGATSYQWFRDGILFTTTSTPSIFVTTSGYYKVEAAYTVSCPPVSSNTVNAIISFPPAPLINAHGSTQLCPGDSVTLSIGSGYSVAWYKNGVLFASGINLTSITVGTSGNYTCSVTTYSPPGSSIPPCNGSSSNSVTVSITNQPLPPDIRLSDDVIFASLGGSYQWFRNGFLLPGKTDSFLIVKNQTGRFTAVHMEGSCTSDTSNPIILSNNYTNLYGLYPNPTTGITQLSFTKKLEGRIGIQIYNLQGILVYEFEFLADLSTKGIELNLSTLPRGMYMLQVINENTTAYQRLIINSR